jgi:hypothetical protein
LHVLGFNARILVRFVRRVDHEVIEALIPVFTKLGASHSDHGNFILYTFHFGLTSEDLFLKAPTAIRHRIT